MVNKFAAVATAPSLSPASPCCQCCQPMTHLCSHILAGTSCQQHLNHIHVASVSSLVQWCQQLVLMTHCVAVEGNGEKGDRKGWQGALPALLDLEELAVRAWGGSHKEGWRPPMDKKENASHV